MRALKIAGLVLVGLVVVVAGVLFTARHRAMAKLGTSWELEDHSVPIPFPLTDEEVQALPEVDRTEVRQSEISRERAVERGRRLVTTRLGCHDCHGADFGGASVVDSPVVGAIIGPNLTQGEGSVTRGFEPSDWVRILRHGVGRSRKSSMMPAIDYTDLSDQEISDVASYVSSFPAVDRSMAPPRLGPIMWMQYGLGDLEFAAGLIDHDKARPVLPPKAEPTAAYGEHLAMVCRGCHGMNYAGGGIPGGDPSWPEAANLTPHTTGLEGWTLAQWQSFFKTGKRPDGTSVHPIMPWRFMKDMSELEHQALYAYFMSLDPVAKGTR